MTDLALGLIAAMGDSWPPLAEHRVGPWRLREGGGGGSRVSSAIAEGPVGPADLPLLEQAAARLGQKPIVMLRPGDGAVDALLAEAGWHMQDETVLYLAPSETFPEAPPMATFAIWPPLAVQTQIWADGGIGPARIAVMDRVRGPKVAILGRVSDRAAGAAFVAVADDTAFLHGLAVVPALRRQGCARDILWAAGNWARSVGAPRLALAVTRANAGARALYASQGMEVVGMYHYRTK
ncbi:MAG: GNAT family N-acetyltransferase [Paracoccaceae bacterium]|nr:MAG: GNAT family N-acetyltransferase [Paracoccaceae bacterium]